MLKETYEPGTPGNFVDDLQLGELLASLSGMMQRTTLIAEIERAVEMVALNTVLISDQKLMESFLKTDPKYTARKSCVIYRNLMRIYSHVFTDPAYVILDELPDPAEFHIHCLDQGYLRAVESDGYLWHAWLNVSGAGDKMTHDFVNSLSDEYQIKRGPGINNAKILGLLEEARPAICSFRVGFSEEKASQGGSHSTTAVLHKAYDGFRKYVSLDTFFPNWPGKPIRDLFSPASSVWIVEANYNLIEEN